jgi:hypothetical protein
MYVMIEIVGVFLMTSAALGGALVSSRIGRSGRTAPARIDAPVVDRVAAGDYGRLSQHFSAAFGAPWSQRAAN